VSAEWSFAIRPKNDASEMKKKGRKDKGVRPDDPAACSAFRKKRPSGGLEKDNRRNGGVLYKVSEGGKWAT